MKTKSIIGLGLLAMVSLNAAPITDNLILDADLESGGYAVWKQEGPVFPNIVSTNTIAMNHDNGFKFFGHFAGTGGRDGSGSLSQRVNILGVRGITAGQIDTGALEVNVGFLELSLDQGIFTDTARLRLTFLDAKGIMLNIVHFEEFSSPNPSHAVNPKWGNFRSAATIPPGTRSIVYTIDFILHSGLGSDVDSYVDQTWMVISDPRIASSPATFSIRPAVEMNIPTEPGVPIQPQSALSINGPWVNSGPLIFGDGSVKIISRPVVSPLEVFRLETLP